MTTNTIEIIKEIVATCKVLKKFTDLQSARIDKLEKILARYQMTEGLEIPERRKDQDLIDKKWREVSELGI